jgi:hypothetical protein
VGRRLPALEPDHSTRAPSAACTGRPGLNGPSSPTQPSWVWTTSSATSRSTTVLADEPLAFNAFTIARATYALGPLIALGVTSFDVTALAPAQ